MNRSSRSRAASALVSLALLAGAASGQPRRRGQGSQPAAPPPGPASAPPAASSAPVMASSAPPPSPPSPARAPVNHYALTISGGISLGAYEAGFNWGVVRLIKAQRVGSHQRDTSLRPQDLVAVTGASAGNINGVLTALAWCQRDKLDEDEGLKGNVFWKTWVPVGWQNLFPGGKTCRQYAFDAGLTSLDCQPGEPAYQRDDGLLTRRAFADVETDIRKRLADADRFWPGCEIPIGVTVTKVTPERIESSDSSWSKLDVSTQRMAVLLEAHSCPVSGGCAGEPGLGFTQPAFELPIRKRPGEPDDKQGDKAAEKAAEAGLFGKRLIVPSSINKDVDARTLLDVVEASSAFPLAFGPKLLRYCESSEPKMLERCRREPLQAKFFDGGLFDNVPLGLAIGLASSSLEGGAHGGPIQAVSADEPKVAFIYLDPDRRRRTPTVSKGVERDDLGRGYSYLLRLVERFVSVSRTYELQTTSRYRASTQFEIAPTSRLFPIMGQHLGAFAAFLAFSFREHDFYVGVYEAMYAVASRSCAERRQGAVWPEGRLAQCVVREMAREFPLLGLGAPEAESASFVVRRLMRLELDTWLDRPMADSVLKSESPVWVAWLDAADTHDELLKAIFEANLRMFQQSRAPGDPQEEPESRFNDLLSEVREAARKAHLRGRIPQSEWQLFEDPETFYWQTGRAISERLVDIEREDGRGIGKRLADAIAFGVYAYSSGRAAGGNVDMDPSTIPPGSTFGKNLAHALPYTGTTELVRGGLEIGYRPTWHLSRQAAIVWPVQPVSYSRVENRTDFRGGAGVMIKFDSAFFNGLELAPFVRAHYRQDNRWDLGAPSLGGEVTLNTLLNHIRLTLGVNDALFLKRPQPGGDLSSPQITLRMGLSDLNGLLYWGGRFVLD